ncbi:hypothetical protein [Candidatus Williamhamiltonella defendens]|nr:hypothetical protein [Candidatus Hamiltonella defensa]
MSDLLNPTEMRSIEVASSSVAANFTAFGTDFLDLSINIERGSVLIADR